MKKIIVFVLLLITGVSYCQNDNAMIDSLKSALKTEKEDTTRLSIEATLGQYLFIMRTSFWDSLYNRAAEKNYKPVMAEALFCLGFIYSDLGEVNKSLEFYKKSLAMREALHDEGGIATTLNDIGSIYNDLGDIPKALEYYHKSLAAREKIGNKKDIAVSFNNIGTVLEMQGDYSESIRYQLKALKLREETNDKKGIAFSYNNLGTNYARMGDKTKALEFYLKSLKVREEINDKRGIALSSVNLGRHYAGEKSYDKAFEYLAKGLKIWEELKDKKNIVSATIGFGRCYLEKKDYSNAQKFLLRSLKLSTELGYPSNIRDAAGLLKKMYQEQNKPTQALEMYELYVTMRDSINNGETRKTAFKTRIQYEFDKKEAAAKAEQEKKDALAADEFEIKELQLSRSRYFAAGLGGLLFLSLIIGVLIIRQNKFRSQQKSMQLEQKLLRSQMNPHFIFNSLNSIHSVVLNGDKKNAASYLASFAKLMRSILESSRFEFISLEKEISLIENYIRLQILRFENEITYHINVDPTLDQQETMLPPMLTQPFIENAIEHGLSNVNSNAQLIVSFKKDADFLIIEVIDNGEGLSVHKNKGGHISMATGITGERLKLLNRNKRMKTSFSITDAFPGSSEHKGVKVSFSIPFNSSF